MGLIFTVNLFSLAILLDNYVFNLPDNHAIKDFFIFIVFGFGFIHMTVFNIRYNKKRKEKLIEEYKDESDESRKRGMVKLIIYEVLSVVFLICVIWIFVKSK
jgi:uncharacterized membrane protein YbhN (UPF0104 family)